MMRTRVKTLKFHDFMCMFNNIQDEILSIQAVVYKSFNNNNM